MIRNIKVKDRLKHLTISVITSVMLVSGNYCLALADSSAVENIMSNALKGTNELGFQENKGQMFNEQGEVADYVLFKVKTPELNIWVTNTGLTYQFYKIEREESEENPDDNFDLEEENRSTIKWNRVDMILKGASIKKENVSTEGDITKSELNYYLGRSPNGIFDVKTYKKIIIKEIYPGIDWALYITENGKSIKHDFIVHPEADPTQINLIYEGNGDMDIADNQLLFKNNLGEITEGELLCYQGDENNIIKSAYKVYDNKELTMLGAGINEAGKKIKNNTEKGESFSYNVKVNLDTYNETQDLIIDPQLVWGTLFGGEGTDAPNSVNSIDFDSINNMFISGQGGIVNFPFLNPGSGAYFNNTFSTLPISFPHMAYISKFDTNGALLWSTFFGGPDGHNGVRTKISNNQELYFAGNSSSTNFPTVDIGGFFQATKNGVGFQGDGIIGKFDLNGVLLWSTFIGAEAADYIKDIAFDSVGNVFFIANTKSATFPVVDPGGTSHFRNYTGPTDEAIIGKFDAQSNLVWSTHYGGGSFLNDLDIDSNGDLFVLGTTGYTSNPTTTFLNSGTFFSNSVQGDRDAIIAKFKNDGSLLWATLFGGNGVYGSDKGNTLIIDLNDNVWISGQTNSTSSFPLLNSGGHFQGTLPGVINAYISKFDNLGNLIWSTYYGGNFVDDPRGVAALDECNNVYFAFLSRSSNAPIPPSSGSCNYLDSTKGGNGDAVIVQFDNSSNILWSSYIGGEEAEDWCWAMDIDNNGDLYLGGEFGRSYATSTNLPLLNPGNGAYMDTVVNEYTNGYIMKFDHAISTNATQTDVITCEPCTGAAKISLTCSLPPYSYVWSNGSQTINTTQLSDSITGLCAGNYSVTISSNCNQTEIVNFNITDLGRTSTIDSTNKTICEGDSILVGGIYRKESGAYSDTLFGGNSFGCDSIIFVELGVSIPQDINIGNDTIINKYESIGLNIDGISEGTHSWSPSNNLDCDDCPTPVSTPEELTTYIYMYTDTNGCITTDTIQIDVLECNVKIPTAFTPDGDGINDYWNISCVSELDNVLIRVYNRWGGLVYESTGGIDYNPWDGMSENGKALPIGTYYYILEGLAEESSINGMVTIIK